MILLLINFFGSQNGVRHLLPLSAAVHAERLPRPRHLRPVQRGGQHAKLWLEPAKGKLRETVALNKNFRRQSVRHAHTICNQCSVRLAL
jgi:hypothetical protein